MKIAYKIFISLPLLFFFGCGDGPVKSFHIGSPIFNVYQQFSPAEIKIVALTSIKLPEDNLAKPDLNLIIDFVDQFGSRIKTPYTLRVELYEYTPRTASEKGKRIKMWPDMDLTDIQTNNLHWNDYLRSYEFTLPMDFRPAKDTIFVLETTCMCPAKQRITASKQLLVK